MKGSILDSFHPLVKRWFIGRFERPLDIQERAWARIVEGKNVLVSAPTGSGKTLAAFLSSLDRIITGSLPLGHTSVLYVSPLKALNNDIRSNLLGPLEEISRLFENFGLSFPEIRVLVRSGDTPQIERQRMVRHPPEILITTPESLNLILSSPRAREMLKTVRVVILDEVHAVCSNKRGTHLITAVERIALMAREFQRIALSATVTPLDRVAAFVGGFRREVQNGSELYSPRPVSIVVDSSQKKIEVSVHGLDRTEGGFWDEIAGEVGRIVEKNRSTLIFTNTRRQCEKLASLINEGEAGIAYSHHGSLSRELRSVVETRMREGRLKAIVATSSLELGIDIGELDSVLLVGTPASVTSGFQRIGRAGHSVRSVTKGRFYPTHPRDILDAAVMARCIVGGAIEESEPVLRPLDVLAQIVVSMTGIEPWDIDRLFSALRTSYPYHDLTRRQFDLVLAMLAGRYAGSRIRELSPRISIDRISNTVKGREGCLRLLYHSGGTIPDRGYYDLRIQGSGVKIGELDEEFVWERKPNDRFIIGAQRWRIVGIDSQKVEVVPWQGRVNSLVFWKAQKPTRGFFFSSQIGDFLERWNENVGSDEFRDELKNRFFLDEIAVRTLVDFLVRQKKHTSVWLPHRHHLLVEHCHDPEGRTILHTLWGDRVNRPFSIALQAVWEQRFGLALEVFSDDDCIMILSQDGFDLRSMLPAVGSDNVEDLIRAKLEHTGFFSSRFRENAAISLLLPKSSFGRRRPLWLLRIRAKQLMDGVMGYQDFPILAETWRSCLRDEFDIGTLKSLLDELHEGQIRISEVNTETPSPFAGGIVFRQTQKHMYEGDEPYRGRTSSLSEEIMREVVRSSRLRPRIDNEIVTEFEAKAQRTYPGYSPKTADELLLLVKERVLVPQEEWKRLLAGIENDWGTDAEAMVRSLSKRLVRVKPPGSDLYSVTAFETLPRLASALGIEQDLLELSSFCGGQLPSELPQIPFHGETLSGLLSEWLSSYGPVDPKIIVELFGIDDRLLAEVLGSLTDADEVVVDEVTEGAASPQICDRRNLETLLRLNRKKRRLKKPRPARYLGPFLAFYHGLVRHSSRRVESREGMKEAMEKLFGYPLSAVMWEIEILPARFSDYQTSWLDSLLLESELSWFGCGQRRVSFCFASDFDLFVQPEDSKKPDELLNLIKSELRGVFGYNDLKNLYTLPARELEQELLRLIWKGRISSVSYQVVRRSLLAGSLNKEQGARGRGTNRWTRIHPAGESFYLIQDQDIEHRNPQGLDALDEEEINRDRVRQLLFRYGVLFRDILESELPHMRWSGIFRTLRIMELSGEVVSGYFFEGVSGVQFCSESFLDLIGEWEPEDTVYWMNACDPASLCGVGIEGLSYRLPPRIPSTHLVFHGAELVLVSRGRGRKVDVYVPPDSAAIVRYLEFFRMLAGRDLHPQGSVRVDYINGALVHQSPYLETFLSFGFRRLPRGIVLHGYQS